MKTVLLRWLQNKHKMAGLMLAYMGTIFVLSSIPDDGSPVAQILEHLSHVVQNSLHIPVFGGLALLWWVTFKLWQLPDELGAMLAVMISGGYGGLDEVHQHFVKGRTMSLGDFALDLVGVGLALLIVRRFIAEKVNAYLVHRPSDSLSPK